MADVTIHNNAFDLTKKKGGILLFTVLIIIWIQQHPSAIPGMAILKYKNIF